MRARLHALWGAECFDRYGLTEAGSVAAECSLHGGVMHVLDDEFIVEIMNTDGANASADQAEGELVLTALGRSASPVIRYRTGDHVRLARDVQCGCGHRGTLILGGVTRMPSQL